MPTSSSSWLPQSAKLWIASASIVPLPVKMAAAVFTRAMPKLAPSAVKIALSEPESGATSCSGRGLGLLLAPHHPARGPVVPRDIEEQDVDAVGAAPEHFDAGGGEFLGQFGLLLGRAAFEDLDAEGGHGISLF